MIHMATQIRPQWAEAGAAPGADAQPFTPQPRLSRSLGAFGSRQELVRFTDLENMIPLSDVWSKSDHGTLPGLVAGPCGHGGALALTEEVTATSHPQNHQGQDVPKPWLAAEKVSPSSPAIGTCNKHNKK